MVANTKVPELIEQLRGGGFEPAASVAEADWYALWGAEAIGELDSLSVALKGGALADRLAWVFLAGYQGMMRYAFPFCPRDGWSSYVASEDRSGEFPGVTLASGANGYTLSGYKSWVAASDHVDHLVVRVGAGRELEAMIVLDRDALGVTLTTRPRADYLGDLSQGRAAFENVAVARDRVFGSADLPRHFEHSEPHHVLTAINAFIASHTMRLGAESGIVNAALVSIRRAVELAGEDVEDDAFIIGLAEIDSATTQAAGAFEALIEAQDPALYERWQTDRRLVNMHSAGLQKRATWLLNR